MHINIYMNISAKKKIPPLTYSCCASLVVNVGSHFLCEVSGSNFQDECPNLAEMNVENTKKEMRNAQV